MEESNVAWLENTLSNELHFTRDHEWIHFQGSIAYIGVCPFKLIGIHIIEKLEFINPETLLQAGNLIGSLYYGEYKIDIHMPVAGKVLSFNDHLTTGDYNLLLQQPLNKGWFALIVPESPHDVSGLIEKDAYESKINRVW